MRICCTGGGTGGHVYPALAVMEELKRTHSELSCFWIGSRKGPERTIIAQSGLDADYYAIPTGKLRRYISLKNIIDLFRIPAGIMKAAYLLAKLRPDVIFSKGGFVSVPVVIAGKMLGLSVLTHESDLTPGLATRINSRFADLTLVAYEKSKAYYNQRTTCRVTGNPIRSEILNAERDRSVFTRYGITPEKKVVLVLGGSQGALEINDVIWQWARDGIEGLHIIHQTGKATYKKLTYPNYTTIEHIGQDLGVMLKSADLVISRSGAGAIWEIAASRTPMLLIPKTDFSSRGDQLENAQLFCDAGGALMLHGGNLDHERLKTYVNMIITDEKRSRSMVQSATELIDLHGVQIIAALIQAYA
jgi:UDP-N-acetylglucosamine--N-acetylmuramyl-(pentapeptide) pyrophosphoryl-undecaprenol N-acetylglucosamine transferase